MAERSGTLWVAGNGGSAAVADHAACDLMAAAHAAGWQPGLRCVSLGANGPVVTALASDLGFEEVFRHQLEVGLQPGDGVLLISSSGNSPNILTACRYGKERGIPTMALVGFDGGILARLADHVVRVPADSYGMCEDTHQSVVHLLAQYIAARSAGYRRLAPRLPAAGRKPGAKTARG